MKFIAPLLSFVTVVTLLWGMQRLYAQEPEASSASCAAPSPVDSPVRAPPERLAKLSPLQREVILEGGTERAFSGIYWDHHEEGLYRCAACGAELFSSETKYDSGSGWPSFHSPFREGAVTRHEDNTLGMRRVEIRCANCGGHLGHVFPDGPKPTGERFCVNSASLEFEGAGAAGGDEG